MRLYRPGFLTRLLYPEALCRVKTSDKVLYLTFDDGPDVRSTIPLMNLLSKNRIKAVFFCSGKAAAENPDLVDKLKSESHIIGNHGFDHLDGFFTSTKKYLDDIKRASLVTSERIMRPPYGHMRFKQYSELKKTFRIIMWDIMPYDFDKKFGSARSLSVTKKLIRPGSIIVFHDRPGSNTLEFIEDFIVFARGEGYKFDVLH
jgi:peptidoglycan/xylan/chitin deacetylase (PgdA/CDA1 family)